MELKSTIVTAIVTWSQRLQQQKQQFELQVILLILIQRLLNSIQRTSMTEMKIQV